MRISTLIGTSLATAAAAAVGSVVTTPAVETWYPKLAKPSFVPPDWAFPVAWTAVYADIAVTSAVTLDQLDENGDHTQRQRYLAALGANLVLNFEAMNPANTWWSKYYNLLDKAAPIVPDSYNISLARSNTIPQRYDSLGRNIAIGTTINF